MFKKQLSLISFYFSIKWTSNWKLSFNPDWSKQPQKAIFSQKINKVYHSPFLFNDSTIQQISNQKHLGIQLNEDLTFKYHIDEKMNKANKGIVIIRKFNNILPRCALLTVFCKAPSQLWWYDLWSARKWIFQQENWISSI